MVVCCELFLLEQTTTDETERGGVSGNYVIAAVVDSGGVGGSYDDYLGGWEYVSDHDCVLGSACSVLHNRGSCTISPTCHCLETVNSRRCIDQASQHTPTPKLETKQANVVSGTTSTD